MTAPTWDSPRHRTSVLWVVAIATVALLFDGYDLVVYGTVLPILMDDPTQVGALTAQQAGALGSYALVGVMIGALAAGAVGDRLGRRRMMLVNIVWFSVGMALSALSTTVTMLGATRLFTGIGIGALIATVGAMIAEFAPPHKRNLFNAIVYLGFPFGGVLASLLAMLLREQIGWRGLFWIGALPIVVLLPLALAKLPESPTWLVAQGRNEQAQRVSAATGIPTPTAEEMAVERGTQRKVGYAALATRRYARPAGLLGLMSVAGTMLTYGLSTWLPKIMENAGFSANNSLLFLLLLNGGAIFGGLVASRVADRRGPQAVIATTFGLAAVSLVVLTFGFPLPVLFTAIAVTGVGAIGTQVLIYGFVANYFPTSARAAGVAWCAGFGRLGGISGPLIGGLLIGAGLGTNAAFYIFAGVALIGMTLTLMVPSARSRNIMPEPALVV